LTASPRLQSSSLCVEAFLPPVNGQPGFGHMLAGFTLPAFLGNVVGGTALCAVISHARIMKEL
jgi:formate-nitrite transporter family protein